MEMIIDRRELILVDRRFYTMTSTLVIPIHSEIDIIKVAHAGDVVSLTRYAIERSTSNRRDATFRRHINKALRIAAKTGQQQLMRVVIELGAVIDRTSFGDACWSVKMLQFMITNYSLENSMIIHCMNRSIELGSIACLKLISPLNAQLSIESKYYAYKNGDMNMITYILQRSDRNDDVSVIKGCFTNGRDHAIAYAQILMKKLTYPCWNEVLIGCDASGRIDWALKAIEELKATNIYIRYDLALYIAIDYEQIDFINFILPYITGHTRIQTLNIGLGEACVSNHDTICNMLINFGAKCCLNCGGTH